MRRVALTLVAGCLLATALPAPAGASSIGGCPLFPGDNPWHADISSSPVLPQSGTYIDAIGAGRGVKADFGSGLWDGGPIGIPFNVVDGSTPGTSVSFEYDDESDHVPYPVPADPAIEGGAQSDGDRHILIVDTSSCRLFELYAAYPNGDGTWNAGSGAVWDLGSNALRPDGWTSADAAGLPILPGLVRYDEVASGRIDHAIRVTVPRSARAHVYPARHDAGSADASLPPMGLRLRLRGDFDTSGFAAPVQVILQAMKTYGLIVADNGSAWYVSGAPDERWDNDMLRQLGNVKGSDFEAVDAFGAPAAPGGSGAPPSAPPPPASPSGGGAPPTSPQQGAAPRAFGPATAGGAAGMVLAFSR